MFLADRFVKGTCPDCDAHGPVWRQLRQVRRRLQPRRSDRSQEHALGRDARGACGQALVRTHRETARLSWPSGRKAAVTCSAKWPTTWPGTFWASRCAIGTSRGRRRTSGSRFPTARATTGTCGSTRRSVTSPQRPNGAQRHGERSWTTGGAARRSRFITSSARTSRTFTRCSGRPCSRRPAISLPTKVHVHGFLTVDGEKMSKTKGTFVRAATYLNHLDPAYLRYYYASKLGPGLDDLDLNREEFVTKVNSDLVGKVVNLASRTAKFMREEGLAASYPDDGGLFAAGGRRRRSDRRGLRRLRLQPRHAADHGPGRSGQPIRRQRRAVEAAQTTPSGPWSCKTVARSR